MSLIEIFSSDLDSLAVLLRDWIDGAQRTSDRLTTQSQAVDTTTTDLSDALTSLERQGMDLDEESVQLQQASQNVSDQLSKDSHALVQALISAGESCQNSQKVLSQAADNLRANCGSSSARLVASHNAVGTAYGAVSTARTDYYAQTQVHHSKAHGFLDTTRKKLKDEEKRVGQSAEAVRAEMDKMTGRLREHLAGPVAGAVVATNTWLEQDLHGRVSTMVSSRLEQTMRQLNTYQGGVQTFAGDLQQTGAALTSVVQKLCNDLPQTLKTQGVDPVVRLGQDLILNQLIQTMSNILIGSSISVACVGAMPVLKVVVVTLRGLLQISSLAATGNLRADNVYSDHEELDSPGPDLEAAGKPGDGLILGAVHQVVGQLNTGLAGIDTAGRQAVDGVTQTINRGAHAVQEFVHELFCPLCGSKCEVTA